jgi:2-polyprenyl-6-methoxyphenol hydroxylase-like FAD-dependent oxidoreductase
MVIAGGMREKVVVYPIAPGSEAGLRLTNWTVNVKIATADAPIPRRQDWSRPGQLTEILHHLERFAIPQVDVRKLVQATASTWEYPMCDRDPLPYWSRGRVTLLGDAAHAMYPVGSNGAGQAILDADCLARCLSVSGQVVDAFAAYEAERRPITAEIVRLNRIGGPETVIDTVDALAPEGFQTLADVISEERLQSIVQGYSRTAGFSREQVTARVKMGVQQ